MRPPLGPPYLKILDPPLQNLINELNDYNSPDLLHLKCCTLSLMSSLSQ